MADRYWVGGTASWDGTAGTKWSATSGGPGGAAVPTSADDVFFDAASGTVVVTTSGTIAAKSINCTGYTGTLTGNATLNVSGSITLVAGMTYTYNGVITINGTGTITSAGKTLCTNLTIDGIGIIVSLADALRTSNFLTVTAGTFTTNSFNVTIGGNLSSTSGSVRAINLGSSTVLCQGSSPVSLNASNLTFNAGTSTIVSDSIPTTFAGGGLTFYNVSFTNTITGTHTITGSNVFNNFSVTAPSTAGIKTVNFSARQTINGTLSTTGTAGNRRVLFQSTTYGISQVLVVNSAASLTDADFRDIIVTGTAAPISGTRIGDLRGNSGITFSAPKTVYWNLGGASATLADNAWSVSSGGTPNIDNFPLAQDTAVFDNGSTVPSGNILTNTTVPYIGTVDMGGRTIAIRFQTAATSFTVYGNFICGSGTVLIDTGGLVFSGRNTQTITSAGKTLSGSITIDTFGGTVQLADALNIGSNAITVTNGTFNTAGFSVTAGSLGSSNSNVRTIILGSSTLTLSGVSPMSFSTSTNLTFNAGTSQINVSSGTPNFAAGGGQTFHNVSFTSTSTGTRGVLGSNTFNNLTLNASATGLSQLSLNANQIVNGTLTCAGSSAIARGFVRSDTIGTVRTITAAAISADDCDFRDITIAGAAAGTSPTRAGDCGGNSGITFPAPKTVYWNLAGAQNWEAIGWATSSNGAPAINNFPLAQDTAIFDNAGAADTVAINVAWNIGSVDASLRTTAMTLTIGTSNVSVHGNWLFGSGVTSGSTANVLIFSGRGVQTITSNGVTFENPITIDTPTGTAQLADALTLGSTRTLTLTRGKFNAVTFNVTTGLFLSTSSNTRELLMGSGLWSLTGTGTVWNISSTSSLTFNPQTANIILTNTSTATRSFTGGSLYYNKLTIGGTTGISTTNINGTNTFAELASTKTVAHTIALGTEAQTFGAWTVTGTVGNVVTLTGTSTSHVIAGAATNGIDYLAMGSIGFAATSPGEFYAGPNSTGTAGAPVYRTAKPADSTRYWVGGTGNWSDTARWSTGSGGAGGASVPRSHDDVVFDSLSNATAYTATVNTVTGGIRCKALTIAGPVLGNLTLAGSAAIVGIHGNVTFPATGLTRTYTGAITFSGSTTGKVLTTNGVTLASNPVVNGVGCGWSLGSAWSDGAAGTTLTVTNGSFDTANFAVTIGAFSSSNSNTRSLSFGSSVISIQGLITGFSNSTGLTFDAGTSSITCTSSGAGFNGGSQTFYNVTFNDPNVGTCIINGANTFNNLTLIASTTGLRQLSLAQNQTINGTFTCTTSSVITRYFVRSDTVGTTRTLTCAAFSGTDVDFRDITIAGAAAPVSGTRLGDCRGNSGITFPSPKTVYWSLAAGGNWQSTAWATGSGGTPAVNNFPLAQDTAIIENTGLNTSANIGIGTPFNVSSIDMSTRTAAMSFSVTSGTAVSFYGNLTFGSGTSYSGTTTIIFSGRPTQTLTTAGKTFTGAITIDSFEGSLVLQDSLITNFSGAAAIDLRSGTFNTNSFNVSLTGGAAGFNATNGSLPRTFILGSETWTISGTAGWTASGTTIPTISGTRTGTISLTSASAKTFTGGGLDYGNITLNNGGAGGLTITGNNSFKDLTATQTATSAATISLGTTTQRLAQFSGSGQAGRLLTITGTSATSPAALIFTGTGIATNAAVDYLTLIGIRAYPTTDTWYAGNNSITTASTGTLGWIYAASVAPSAVTSGNFLMFAMP
jgi:hypothetical protein